MHGRWRLHYRVDHPPIISQRNPILVEWWFLMKFRLLLIRCRIRSISFQYLCDWLNRVSVSFFILFGNMFFELIICKVLIYSLMLNRQASVDYILFNYKLDVLLLQRQYISGDPLRMFNIILLLILFCIMTIAYYAEASLYFLGPVSLAMRCDVYTLSFVTLLIVVRSCVAIWSYYYMGCERAYHRFASLILWFIMRMIGLVFFSNLYMTLIGWDGLGVSSFLLVIYYKNRKSLGSGMITALTNRLGDCFLLCLLALCIAQGSHLSFLTLLVIMGMTKRAQIPFSSWLPAAIAAPTPVSALVHSSTLVTAGVYVLIRYCNTDPTALSIIGSCTILMSGICACAESDIKKVVALRTLSQLGVMMVALGAHEKSYCFFHLISHACFKALLFICVGRCIHSLYGSQDYRSFNGFGASLGISTFYSVANISLIGFIFTSGFYRKDIIIELLYNSGFGSWTIVIFLIGIGLTACYSLKMIACTIIVGSFTGSCSWRLGGYRWCVKLPLWILGALRLTFGSKVHLFSNNLTIALFVSDKLMPIILMMGGALTGYFLSSAYSPFLGSIFNLTPNSQQLAYRVAYEALQKPLDKGWIELGSLSLTPLSASVILSYRPTVSLGLITLLLFLFFYVQYH